MILIQFNFDFPAEMMGEVLVAKGKELAESINLEPGFISKVWIENPETKKAGGIYVFKDKDSADKYIQMHTERVKQMGVKNIEYQIFTVNETLSKINHGI